MMNNQPQMLRIPGVETNLQEGSIHNPDHLDHAYLILGSQWIYSVTSLCLTKTWRWSAHIIQILLGTEEESKKGA